MTFREWALVGIIVGSFWLVATAGLLGIARSALRQKELDAEERKRRFQLAVSRALWLAFVHGLFLFTVVGVGFWPALRGTSPQSPDRLLIAIFLVMGATSTAALFKWHKVGSRPKSYLSYSQTRFAFAESVGIFGFILLLQSSSWPAYLPFLIWSATLLWLAKPTKADQQRFLAAQIP